MPCVVYPHRCWVSEEEKNEHTLEHEQTHVNIALLCAKKLQKDLDKMKIFSFNAPNFGKAFENWTKEMNAMEDEFDAVSNKGRDIEREKIFIARINADLNEFRSNRK